jgi:hypothetical protein
VRAERVEAVAGCARGAVVNHERRARVALRGTEQRADEPGEPHGVGHDLGACAGQERAEARGERVEELRVGRAARRDSALVDVVRARDRDRLGA